MLKETSTYDELGNISNNAQTLKLIMEAKVQRLMITFHKINLFNEQGLGDGRKKRLLVKNKRNKIKLKKK